MLYFNVLILHYRLFLLLFCSSSEVNVIILALRHQKWPFCLIYTKVYVFFLLLSDRERDRQGNTCCKEPRLNKDVDSSKTSLSVYLHMDIQLGGENDCANTLRMVMAHVYYIYVMVGFILKMVRF